MQPGKRYNKRKQQLIEKCRLSGFDSLTPRESAELFLCLAASFEREDVLFQSHITANPYAFFSYTHEKLLKYGANESEAFLIEQFPAIAQRLLRNADSSKNEPEKQAEEKLSESKANRQKRELENNIMSRFVGAYSEYILLMIFNESFSLVFSDFISTDRTTEVDLDIRLICKVTCKYGGKYVLIAHNHPSGLSIPSPQDCEATRALFNSLCDLGIWLLDHYIVTRTECVPISKTYDFRNTSDKYLASVREKLEDEYEKRKKKLGI